jgi:isopenicillin-N N-acyltransferase like protein
MDVRNQKVDQHSKDNEKNPKCNDYNENIGVFTFSSAVYTLTVNPSVQLTKGSPDKAAYHEYFFKK